MTSSGRSAHQACLRCWTRPRMPIPTALEVACVTFSRSTSSARCCGSILTFRRFLNERHRVAPDIMRCARSCGTSPNSSNPALLRTGIGLQMAVNHSLTRVGTNWRATTRPSVRVSRELSASAMSVRPDCPACRNRLRTLSSCLKHSGVQFGAASLFSLSVHVFRQGHACCYSRVSLFTHSCVWSGTVVGRSARVSVEFVVFDAPPADL